MAPRKSQSSKRAAAAVVEDEIPGSTAATNETSRAKRQRVADAGKSTKRQSTQAAKQKGSVAGASASTAQEAPEIGHNVAQMIEKLPELSENSEVLLQQLIPAARETLETVLRRWKPSSQPKTLARKANEFEASYSTYTNDDYVDAEIISQSLLDTHPTFDGRADQWKPDILLQQANLTKMLKTLVTLDPKDTSSLELLEMLEADFPRIVASSVTKGGLASSTTGQSALFDETLQVAIALRTQLIVLFLQTESENANIDVESLLRKSFYQDSEDATKSLRGWDVPGFSNANGSFHDSVELALYRHLDKVKRALSGSVEVDLIALGQQYPWNQFLTTAFHWAAERRQEIDKEIERRGGAEGICDDLKSLIGDSSSVDANFQGGSREAYKSLLAMQGQTDAQGDQENQPPTSTGRSKRKSGRGQRLNDTQEHRRAVSPIRDNEEPEPTPDGGFSRQGRSQNDASYSPSQERAIAPPSGDRSTARSYLEANEKARLVAAEFKRNKAPRERKRWSNEEIQKLMDLIADFGCGWESLKKHDQQTGHILVHRHAVDLKDKARNMKFDYLKAGLPLPPNFDKVLLDSKFRNKLEEMGIDYTQQRMRAPRAIED